LIATDSTTTAASDLDLRHSAYRPSGTINMPSHQASGANMNSKNPRKDNQNWEESDGNTPFKYVCRRAA
jgi:hypothetical protein